MGNFESLPSLFIITSVQSQETGEEWESGMWDREKHFQVLTVFLNLDWPGQTSGGARSGY